MHQLAPHNKFLRCSIQFHIPACQNLMLCILPYRSKMIIPAKQCFHTRQQLLLHEWLYEIIIGTHFQSKNPVTALRLRGQHKYRNVAHFPNLHRRHQAIAIRHHHIHYDQVRLFCLILCNRCISIMRHRYRIPSLLKFGLQ